MIIVTSRETGPRTEYIPLRQYYHRCNLDRGPDITGGLKLGKTSICFLVFFPKYCSKALSVNILGDPRHHPLWQQCGLPISLWMVGTTKGEMIPLHWIQHFLLIPVCLAGSTQGKTLACTSHFGVRVFILPLFSRSLCSSWLRAKLWRGSTKLSIWSRFLKCSTKHNKCHITCSLHEHWFIATLLTLPNLGHAGAHCRP